MHHCQDATQLDYNYGAEVLYLLQVRMQSEFVAYAEHRPWNEVRAAGVHNSLACSWSLWGV